MTGFVAYGYLWDEKREHWLVDDEAAAVVQHIFSLVIDGHGPYQITKQLEAEKIEIPSVHLARYAPGNRGIFQKRQGRVYQNRTGGAGHAANQRYCQEKEKAVSGYEQSKSQRISLSLLWRSSKTLIP